MQMIEEYSDDGRILGKGVKLNGVKQGNWKYFFVNGNIKSEVEYKDGIRHGIYRDWNVDGVLQIETFFQEGKTHGLWKEYYENGNVREIARYVDGIYFPKDFWDTNGVQILKDGNGYKLEFFLLETIEQHFVNGKFVKEIIHTTGSFGKFNKDNSK